MKVALAIYWLMLVLEGGVAWRACGSPYLLAASMAGVLIHALLGIRPGQVAEITRLITCSVLVGLCPLYYANDPYVYWLCLLALPHLLSATQCVEEIQSSGTTSEVNCLRIGHSVFTLGFYASLALTYLMLNAEHLKLERATGTMLALVIALLGMVAWEAGRGVRFKKGITAHALSGRGKVSRIALVALGAVLFALIFAVVLPLVSDALCHFSPRLKLPRNLREAGPRQLPATHPGKHDATLSNDDSDPDAGPVMTARSVESALPMRGTLELSDEVEVVLKFEVSAQAESLTKEGPLYVRTRAVSQFKDGQWVTENQSGYWLTDATDGNLDGKVEVSKPLSGEIAHEVFIPQSTGDVLPALAGVTTYALPEIFVHPDHWFQNEFTGDIRYKAWSKPDNILSYSHSNLKPGNPGGAYLARLVTPFGTRLTELAEVFRAKRPDLPGRLDLLRQYFQSEYQYSMTIENKSGMPPLENFIFEERKGYCDFFASAGALILRHMGIPSRVAYGYKEGEHDDATDTWIFRGYHAHAWTEVFVQDHGWIICDFTPSSSDRSHRTGTPPPFDMARFEEAGKPGNDAGHKRWNKPSSLESIRSRWVPAVLGLGLLGALVGFLFRKRRTSEQRAAEKATRERAGRDRQPAYFLEFLRMCEALGHRRLDGQTLMEFHKQLKHSRFCSDDFDDLAAYYYKSRYEDAPQDVPREQGFLRRIRDFRNRREKD